MIPYRLAQQNKEIFFGRINNAQVQCQSFEKYFFTKPVQISKQYQQQKAKELNKMQIYLIHKECIRRNINNFSKIFNMEKEKSYSKNKLQRLNLPQNINYNSPPEILIYKWEYFIKLEIIKFVVYKMVQEKQQNTSNQSIQIANEITLTEITPQILMRILQMRNSNIFIPSLYNTATRTLLHLDNSQIQTTHESNM